MSKLLCLFRWDAYVSRRVKRTINGGLIAALVVAAPVALMTFGVYGALVAVGSLGVLLAGYNLLAVVMDAMFIRPVEARHIQHANGRRAVVDPQRYRPLPQAEEPRR